MPSGTRGKTDFHEAPEVVWFRATRRSFVSPSPEPDGQSYHWFVSPTVDASLDLIVVHPIGASTTKGVPVLANVLAGYRSDGESRETASGKWHRFRKLPFAETKELFEQSSK